MLFKTIPFLIVLLTAPISLPPVCAQPQLGEKTPGFITTALGGQRVVLKDYWEQQGKKVLVLSFFATWCQPCKEDLKYLQTVQEKNAGRGLQVLAIVTQDRVPESTVKEFMNKLGVNLPVLMDEYGIIGKRYSVTALPCNFVIDKDGVLRAKYFGYGEEVKRQFEAQVNDFLSRR